MQAAGVSYTCDYSGESVVVRDAVIDAGDGSSVTVIDAEGAVDAAVGPIDVVTNSFTAGGGDGYEAFGAAENVALRADDDAQIHYERAFREFLEGLPAGDDGIPVISAADPVYADELSDGRITLIDA
jgi:2',3'-cyclic-nucleotide 2'-phosphodiesterase (5'-nucleotidase family)